MNTIEFSKKRVEISQALFGWDHAQWSYEIFLLPSNNKYLAKLWIYDEYDDYLVQWKVYKTSPELATLEEAEAYALETWVNA